MEKLEAMRREQEDSLNRALELVYLSSIPVENILDFGCGLGITVSKLREILGLNAVGVDPYGEFVENEYLHRKSITQLIEIYGREYFDAIYSIEVFEHLENPKEVFRLLDELLKPGGKILVNTGTVEFLNQFDKEYNYIDPLVRGHISIWSLKSMSRLAKEFGYSASFMGARTYAMLLSKSGGGKDQPSVENRNKFKAIGTWYPQLMQEYLRLVEVEREFENSGSYIKSLLNRLR
jgi:cyclopropane fatty-acyl-phospholipid synthase-like methyltransferase